MSSDATRADRATTGAALAEAFAALVAADEVDILPPGGSAPAELPADDAGDNLDVAGEEWTLHLEGFPGPRLAYLAVEDEPEAPTAQAVRAAREDAVSPAALAAIAAADAHLGGALVAALAASHDLLSLDLADAVAARRGTTAAP